MNSPLLKRQVVVIDWKDTNVEIIHPQFAVLLIDNQSCSGKRHLDMGAFCYVKRGKGKPMELACTVEFATLDSKRIPVVRELIEYLRSLVSGSSAITTFQKFNSFIDWIDSQQCRYAFDELASMKKSYQDYTLHLLHRTNSSGISGKPIKRHTAAQYQSAARTVVMLATGLSEPTVKGIATYIPQKNGQVSHISRKLPDADTQARTFAALVNFIEESHRVLVKGEPFPMHLASPNGDTNFLYSAYIDTVKSKTANFSIAPLLNSSPAFPTWNEVKAHFSVLEESTSTTISKSIYDKYKSTLQKQ